ncbi:MAG: hypothetical protein ACYDA4_09600 [Ignavibacteriaceae bacterium]
MDQSVLIYSKRFLPKSFGKLQILIAILLFSTTAITYGQKQIDSLNFIQTTTPLNLLSTTFDKQINIYSLTTNLQYNNKFTNWLFDVSENYNSTFIKSDQNSTTVEHFFSSSGNYSFNKTFSLGLLVNNNIYSDSRQIDVNQASTSSLIGFGEITPEQKIVIAPFAGYTNNRQIGEVDYGPVYGGEGYLNNLDFSNFVVSSQMKFRNEDISPRKNILRYMNILVTNELEKNVFNITNYQFFQNRKDFYFAADSITSAVFNITNNIQSRTETTNVLQDQLKYNQFLDIFTQSLLGRVTWRTIDRNTRYRTPLLASSSIFDTKVNELKLEFESTTNYNSKYFDGVLKFNYSERDETHITKPFSGVSDVFFQERSDIESRNDNIAKRISLSLLGSINLSPNDLVYFSFLQNKLRYDTPSAENFDDRDELLSIVRIKYVKKLTPFFDAFLSLEGTFNHIVYIYSESSSNNNINRIIKLKSGGDYSGKYFSSFNSFSVMANYTVYDFEDLNPNYRSFSFRQFSATDSTRFILSSNLSFEHDGYVKLTEQGDLKWASFSTHPTRYLEEIFSEPKFTVNYYYINFSLGARLFSLTTFNYQGLLKVLDTRYISIGPLTEISYSIKKSLTFFLTGWYEFISANSNSAKQQANLDLNMNWNF